MTSRSKGSQRGVVILNWLAAVLLAWGVFIGLLFAIAPLIVAGRGNIASSLVGVGLVLLCGFGLLKLSLGRDGGPSTR